MSGCQPTLEMPVCVHGIPVKFHCAICNRDEKIEKLFMDHKLLGDCKFLERLEKLEKTVSELVDKIAAIGNHCYAEKKTPHKCPVCTGFISSNFD